MCNISCGIQRLISERCCCPSVFREVEVFCFVGARSVDVAEIQEKKKQEGEVVRFSIFVSLIL